METARGGEWLAEFRENWYSVVDALGTWRDAVIAAIYSIEDAEHSKDARDFNLLSCFGNLTSVIALWCDVELSIDPTAMVELNLQLQKWRPVKVIQPDGSVKTVFRGQRLEVMEELLDRALHCWDRVLHATTATMDSPSSECVPNSLRPAYLRDHYWLKWNGDKKWGPSTIRDKWNGLSDDQRKRICPQCWECVGGDGPKGNKAGAEVVKKALSKAKSEKKP